MRIARRLGVFFQITIIAIGLTAVTATWGQAVSISGKVTDKAGAPIVAP